MRYKFLNTLIFFLLLKLQLTAEILITNRVTDIDLSDIIKQEKTLYSEVEVKQLCAKITERYHSEGYTAFFIKSAIIRNNNIIELIFCEPIVINISIKGINEEEQGAILNTLYNKNTVFNELILGRNIQEAKQKYSLKKLSVDVEKTAGDEISLSFEAEMKTLGGEVSVNVKPLYGFFTYAALDGNIGACDAIIFYKTTMDLQRAGFTVAGAGISTASDKTGCFLNLDYTLRDDAAYNYGDMFYSSRSADINTGFFYKQNAVILKIYVLTSLTNYERYPDCEDGISLTGAGFSFLYNDYRYKIDPSEVVTAGFKAVAGRNIANEYQIITMNLFGTLSFPVLSRMSLALDVDSEYTTDNNNFFQFYVFDNKVPLRGEDYTVSSFRSSCIGGIRFYVVKNVLYLESEYIAACYDQAKSIEFVDGYGLMIAAVLNSFKLNTSLTIERGETINNTVFMLSASGSF